MIWRNGRSASQVQSQWLLGNHLLAASSAVFLCQLPASVGSVPVSKSCSEHVHTHLFLHFPLRTTLHKPASWSPTAMWQELSCFALSGLSAPAPSPSWTPPLTSAPTHPQQHTKLQNLNALPCSLICARDRWHWQRKTEVTADCHFMKASYLPGLGTVDGNALRSKVPLNLKDSAHPNSVTRAAHSDFWYPGLNASLTC